MGNGDFWQLRHVSDAGIRHELNHLLRSDARTEARIVAHLAEVHRRKLYLKDGLGCLFKYCQGQLGLSESQAFHRMTAARIARQFPIVFEMIERRRIHLSGLAELRDFLTADNHRELLELAAGKSKRRIKELLASRFPGEAAPDAVRKLPAGRVEPITSVGPNVARGVRGSASEPTLTTSTASASLADSATAEIRPLEQDAEANSIPSPAAEESSTFGSNPESNSVPLAPSDIRYRIQFDAGSRLKAKLELACALSSHSNPRGDLEALFEHALDAYVEQLQKRRFAQVKRPRVKKANAEPATTRGAQDADDATARSVGPLARTRAQGRRPKQRAHISHETRRSVVDQGGLRCSFVAPNGQRCDEQAFLQFHHDRPWSRRGSDEAANLALLCAGHNRLLAEQEFGSRHVEQRIAEARASSKAAR